MTSSGFIGRYQRGGTIAIQVTPADTPDACPIVDFWHLGNSERLTAQLPPVDDNTFALKVFVGPQFIDGTYVASVRYDVDGIRSQHFYYFEVIGGEAKGVVVGIHELRRPLGRAVVTLNEDGTAKIGYNPRLA